jgi:hypothetical protein
MDHALGEFPEPRIRYFLLLLLANQCTMFQLGGEKVELEDQMENGGSKHTIRFFDWRDVLLVQRLQGQGQTLDYEGAGVDGVFPLRDALQSYLLLGTSARRTLVMPGINAFAQYTCSKGSNRVHLTYIAPAPTSADYTECWIDLLEQLVVTIGARGIHHIVAEASDDGPELELLQRAGFGVVTRQTLFRLASPSRVVEDVLALPGLRAWRSTDDWGLRLLFSNTVPQLAQQIEGPVDSAFTSGLWQDRHVLERDGEIIAGYAARRGRVGSALRLLLHPQADESIEALIRHGLENLADGPRQPVYCRVRRYESWLRAPLEASGFEPMARTALLVKHTVARVMTPEWQRSVVVEGRPEMTTPVAHAELRKSLKC